MHEDTLMKMSVFIFLAISAYIGLLWRPRTWLIAAGIFYAIFVLLFTTFFTNMGGFWSGIWGSFDYWLQQQDVAARRPAGLLLPHAPAHVRLPAAGLRRRRRRVVPAAAAVPRCR